MSSRAFSLCCDQWRDRHTSVAVSVCRGVGSVQLAGSLPPVLSEDMLCEAGLVLVDHLGWASFLLCLCHLSYLTTWRKNSFPIFDTFGLTQLLNGPTRNSGHTLSLRSHIIGSEIHCHFDYTILETARIQKLCSQTSH